MTEVAYTYALKKPKAISPEARGKLTLMFYENDICNCELACTWEDIATDMVTDVIHYLSSRTDTNPAIVLNRALNRYMDELGD